MCHLVIGRIRVCVGRHTVIIEGPGLLCGRHEGALGGAVYGCAGAGFVGAYVPLVGQHAAVAYRCGINQIVRLSALAVCGVVHDLPVKPRLPGVYDTCGLHNGHPGNIALHRSRLAALHVLVGIGHHAVIIEGAQRICHAHEG